MKIAFDSQIFSMQRFGGISRYFCELAGQFAQKSELELKVFAPFHINEHLHSIPAALVQGSKTMYVPRVSDLRCSLSLLYSRHLIRKYQPDVIHETYYSPLAYATSNSRKVITIHDMIEEKILCNSKSGQRAIRRKVHSAQCADHIICVSDTTRDDLLAFIPEVVEKVSVVHHGVDLGHHFSLEENALALPSLLSGSYILYVGSRGGYKNFSTLLKAYANSRWLHNNYSIICFGGGPFSSAEKRILVELEVNNGKILQMDGDDRQLAALYRNAGVFVFTSLYEGFGLPLLEAMSLGCPVSCSNCSVFPEVAGEAADFFDPTCQTSVADSLQRILISSDYRRSMILMGKERCKLFSWKNTAEQTLKIYRKLC